MDTAASPESREQGTREQGPKPLLARCLSIFLGWNLGAAVGLTLPAYFMGGLNSNAVMSNVVFWAHLLSVVLVPAVILLGILDQAVARDPDIWLRRKRSIYSVLLIAATGAGAYAMVVRSMLF